MTYEDLERMQVVRMEPCFKHPWDISPKEAASLQLELQGRVILEDRIGRVHTIAGTDVSYDARSKQARAIVAVLSYPNLQLLFHTSKSAASTFPYIPGYLSFREIPPLIGCFKKLRFPPDLFICDGHGLAHPRRFGLACHLGVLFDVPTIGVAKRLLVGSHDIVPQERGAWRPIIHEGETIGAALRSRPHTHPIYVSIGHRISLETAIVWVMRCLTRFRLPETTRFAHRLSKAEM
jgi:deoxyribonuclease V